MAKTILARSLLKFTILGTVVPFILLLIFSITYLYQKTSENYLSKLQGSVQNIGLDLEERLYLVSREIKLVLYSLSELNKERETPSKQNIKDVSRLTNLLNNIYISDSNLSKEYFKLITPKKLPNSKNLNISNIDFIMEKSETGLKSFITIKNNQEKNIIVAEINPNSFWQLNEATFSADAALCVFHNNQVLVCDNKTHENFSLEKINSDDFLIAKWNIDKTTELNLPNLQVVSWIDKTIILHQIYQYILFSILLVLILISIIIISRRNIIKIISPLEKTKKHIGKYIGNVKQSKDELEFLVDSLDYASDTLDQQHDSFSAMAKIDKLILSNLDLNSTMDTLKNRLRKLMHPHSVNIYIKNLKKFKKNMINFKIHGNNKNNNGKFSINKKEIDAIFATPHHLLIDNIQSKLFKYFTYIKGTVFTLIIPVFLEEEITALITLHYKNIPDYNKQSLELTRDLANRFAVAIANAAKEDKLYHQAHFDLLTDLPNRLLFHERLEHALNMAKQTKRPLAILFIDLDKFKSLNDSFGHSAGDEYLKIISQRIKSCIKSDDTVARFGGDEFVVILSNQKIKPLMNNISKITDKIQHEIAKPCKLSENVVVLNSSIGISLYPEDADNAEDLLKAADAALYYAKSQDRGNYQFYSKDISHEAKELLRLENNLNGALANDEFELYFQPRINIETEKVVSAEALIRWKKNYAYISPEDFIPIAENNGLIQSVGEWILQNACLTAKKWHNLGLPIRVSINLSAKQLQNAALITRIDDILKTCELAPNFLELELTENILMKNNAYTLASLKKLQSMGIVIAIDDFGTGYSSLSYLKKFSVDVIKIDKSFIKNINYDKVNQAIVSSIITLANRLNIRTVAEGVENTAELQWLIQHNCKEIQGYLFSEPLGSTDFQKYLLTHNIRHSIPSTI